METEDGIQLVDLRGVIRRRAGLVAVITAGVFLSAVFISAILPNEYEAATLLLVEPQSISQNLVESGLPETEINNRLHLIQMQILSRGRLSRVISDLRVYPKLENEMTREELIGYMRDEITVVPLLPELAAQAQAQTGARAQQVVINTFLLIFRHSNPKVAADVANRLARDFIDEHIRDRVQLSADTSEFIDDELNHLARTIELVEAQIAEVKQQNAGTLPEDFVASQRLYERALSSLRDVEREVSIATSDVAFYGQQVASGGGDDYASRSFMTPARRLDALEVAISEYRSRGFTDKHPDIIATLDEIALLRIEASKVAESDSELSFAQRSAQAEERRAMFRLDGARAEMVEVKTQLAQLEERMAATPRVAEQLDGLGRRHRALLDNFNNYSSKRLEARVAAQVESRQKGERFRVLEAAYPATEASSPNRLLILVFGLLVGLALGGGAALIAEVSDESFHDAKGLQSALSLPVLAAIPEVLLASDTARLRGMRMRRLIAVGGVTAVVLVASISGYWIVNGAPTFLSPSVSAAVAEN